MRYEERLADPELGSIAREITERATGLLEQPDGRYLAIDRTIRIDDQLVLKLNHDERTGTMAVIPPSQAEDIRIDETSIAFIQQDITVEPRQRKYSQIVLFSCMFDGNDHVSGALTESVADLPVKVLGDETEEQAYLEELRRIAELGTLALHEGIFSDNNYEVELAPERYTRLLTQHRRLLSTGLVTEIRRADRYLPNGQWVSVMRTESSGSLEHIDHRHKDEPWLQVSVNLDKLTGYDYRVSRLGKLTILTKDANPLTISKPVSGDDEQVVIFVQFPEDEREREQEEADLGLHEPDKDRMEVIRDFLRQVA